MVRSGPGWSGPGRSSVWSGPTRHNLWVFGKTGPDRTEDRNGPKPRTETGPTILRFGPVCVGPVRFFGPGSMKILRSSRFSNADRVQNISHSIYVTNFPDSATSRDLWNACSVYGTVVDVFIPLKKSKVGKRLAFVRFVKVHNLVRLVENLCTIWIGRHHLFANQHGYKTGSYVNAVNNSHSVPQGPVLSSAPALVLDDECLIDCDLSKYLMGKVKEFSSIPNLYTIFRDEGFRDVKLTYLGELFTWEPSFLTCKEKEYVSNDEFVRKTSNNNDGQLPHDEVFGDVLSSDDEVHEYSSVRAALVHVSALESTNFLSADDLRLEIAFMVDDTGAKTNAMVMNVRKKSDKKLVWSIVVY
uniref:RRM domain-containing protein n=1 Tax=Tanacetum cinerariifolium TaxID=118510 RepID=A0A6L2MYH0_TANCI|nr:hypothetical protein [Tanacetum cinerariifolium]